MVRDTLAFPKISRKGSERTLSPLAGGAPEFEYHAPEFEYEYRDAGFAYRDPEFEYRDPEFEYR